MVAGSLPDLERATRQAGDPIEEPDEVSAEHALTGSLKSGLAFAKRTPHEAKSEL